MKKIFALVTLMAIMAPIGVSAASNLEVAGWVPWWQDTMGIKSDH